MTVEHRIDKVELISLFDIFTSEVVDGQLDKEVKSYLHELIGNIADNKPMYMQKGNDFNLLVNDFISCFYFDDVNGGYTFEFQGIEASGKTDIATRS